MDKVDTAGTLMTKFKIQVKYVRVQDENQKDIKVLVLGGNEVIDSVRGTDIRPMVERVGLPDFNIICESNQPLFYKYVDTPFTIDKLKELLKYKSIKSLSKDDALKINASVKSKQELENDIVYITDEQPVTNSLALAKQFDLNHIDVVKKIYELGSMYPSVLMKIRYDVYSSVIKQSSKAKSEIKGDRPCTENSVHGPKTITERETYDTFIHIPEDVYYQFVKKIGTPMNVNSTDMDKNRKAMERLTHIEAKQDEYFNAFQKVRAFLHNSGTSPKEIDAIIKTRTASTNELMSEVYNYVTRNNSYDNTKRLNLVSVNKLIFNIVNHMNNINAINYIPQTEEEVKQIGTRLTKDESLQVELARIEGGLTKSLKMASAHKIDLHETIMIATDKNEAEILNILEEYDVVNLWNETKC